nr:hypothetical protein [Tanacetum cinerariifolium]
MVESKTPKKQKVQEQIDAQVTIELEEQLEIEDQRMSEQIARDAEVARIHEVEIKRLKARVKLLEDKEGLVRERSRDDAPIKGRNLDEREAAAERVSDDTEEMATVLTSMDAANVLASGVVESPTGSGSIPTASPSAAEVPTSSDVVPTASPVFATATVIDAQVTIELEEQLEREDQRMSEQIARDAEVARIHVEEELQSITVFLNPKSVYSLCIKPPTDCF